MISQITDRFFVGEKLDCNKENLEKHQISFILNVSELPVPKIDGYNGWNRWAPILNIPTEPPMKYVDGVWLDCTKEEAEKTGIEFYWEIKWAYHFLSDLDFSEGDVPTYAMSKVLICCNAGMDRSPFVMAHYLHEKENMTFEQAYDLIESKRPQIIKHLEWAKYFILSPEN